MALKAKYRGDRDADGLPLAHYNGIPARDLSEEDYDALDAGQKRLVRDSDLYELTPEPKSKGRERD